jgi:TRAP-type C4-dicarboxylate transport system substrate-binding protein
MMNLDKFNSLSEEHQGILMDVAADAVDYQRNLAIAGEEEMLATLSEHLEINRDVNSAAFQEASRPAWDRFISNYGSDIIDAILEASAAE